MDLLYGKTLERIDTYSYQINGGGILKVRESGEIKIVFKNNKFDYVTFPLSGRYSRNGWRILAEINDEIARIEKEYENKENPTQ